MSDNTKSPLKQGYTSVTMLVFPYEIIKAFEETNAMISSLKGEEITNVAVIHKAVLDYWIASLKILLRYIEDPTSMIYSKSWILGRGKEVLWEIENLLKDLKGE